MSLRTGAAATAVAKAKTARKVLECMLDIVQNKCVEWNIDDRKCKDRKAER
jgi:hypothetical protein